MLSNLEYKAAANCLKMLAQPVRLKIIDLLLERSMTVMEIATEVEIQQNLASEHLKLLRLCNFVSVERIGRTAKYSIVEPHLANIMECVYAKFANKKNLRKKRVIKDGNISKRIK